MIDQVIRPTPEASLILFGEGVGALVAARAAETGARPAGLILSGAPCPAPARTADLRRLGFGATRAPGAGPWLRDGPDDQALGRTHDRWRGAVTHAWQLANPDLRLGGPSLDWRWAFAELHAQAIAGSAAIASPTLVLGAGEASLCLAIPKADQRVVADAGAALELEDDSRRRGWLTAIEAFLAETTPRPAERVR
jgi:lysophospholipase